MVTRFGGRKVTLEFLHLYTDICEEGDFRPSSSVGGSGLRTIA